MRELSTCSADGCIADVHARGLCKRHYEYQRRGLHLAARCQSDGCSNERPRVNGRRYCDECRDERRRENDRDAKARNRTLQPGWDRRSKWARFGVTPAQVDAHALCDACGTDDPVSRWGTWFGDHDHRCCERGCPKCFRGLVCMDCNVRRITALENEPDALLIHLARAQCDSPLARVAQFLLDHRRLRSVA